MKAQTGPSLAGPALPKGKTHPSYAQLARLQLQESDVAKVTVPVILSSKYAICAVQFCPQGMRTAWLAMLVVDITTTFSILL